MVLHMALNDGLLCFLTVPPHPNILKANRIIVWSVQKRHCSQIVMEHRAKSTT